MKQVSWNTALLQVLFLSTCNLTLLSYRKDSWIIQAFANYMCNIKVKMHLEIYNEHFLFYFFKTESFVSITTKELLLHVPAFKRWLIMYGYICQAPAGKMGNITHLSSFYMMSVTTTQVNQNVSRFLLLFLDDLMF